MHKFFLFVLFLLCYPYVHAQYNEKSSWIKLQVDRYSRTEIIPIRESEPARIYFDADEADFHLLFHFPNAQYYPTQCRVMLARENQNMKYRRVFQHVVKDKLHPFHFQTRKNLLPNIKTLLDLYFMDNMVARVQCRNGYKTQFKLYFHPDIISDEVLKLSIVNYDCRAADLPIPLPKYCRSNRGHTLSEAEKKYQVRRQREIWNKIRLFTDIEE